MVGSGMRCLQEKLQRLKAAFKLWNKSVFGDIQRQVHLAVEEVNRIQRLIDYDGLTYELNASELQAHLVIMNAMNQHDQYSR